MSCSFPPEDSRSFDAGVACERDRVIGFLRQRKELLKPGRFISRQARIEEVENLLIFLETLS